MKSTELTAVIAASSLLVTGTYAWQSFSQLAVNKMLLEPPDVGGRLHDDFDGKDKNVYVENYGSVENVDEDVFARIRIDEYMEVGTDAGTGTGTGLTIVRGDKQNTSTPLLDDPTTWDTYIFGAETESDIREFHDLKFGGSTVYMPTFNKNKDSLVSDINGTVEGLDNSIFPIEDAYDDYVNYSLGQSKTDDAIYDLDDNNTDEGDGAVEGTNIETIEETHTAKSTLNASVISMSSWLSGGCKTGRYWVYDVDGWAYWAQPIEPQTATGLLIDEVLTISKPAEDWFYGVSVVCQIASAGDWGEEDDTNASTSMYASDMTVDGLYVLNKAAGLVRFSGLEIVDEGDSSATTSFNFNEKTGDLVLGYSHDFGLSTYTVINGNDNDPDTHKFTWSVKDSNGNIVSGVIDSDGVFTPTDAMRGTYTVTVTSVLDSSKSASITVDLIGNLLGYLSYNATETEINNANRTYELNGEEFYLIDTEILSDGTKVAKLFISEYTNQGYVGFGTSSVYATSTIKPKVGEWATTWAASGSDISSSDIVFGNDLVSLSEGIPALTDLEMAFLLSQDEVLDIPIDILAINEYYWLRTPSSGSTVYFAMLDGSVSSIGDISVANQRIRPAVWVYL